MVAFIRADHIGRPVFATNAAGVKAWTASYLPFGGVRTSTGTPISAGFPGQWFQTENGLHQNWMRDYDPTMGRYLQADPLGLVDGASVYGYVTRIASYLRLGHSGTNTWPPIEWSKGLRRHPSLLTGTKRNRHAPQRPVAPPMGPSPRLDNPAATA